MRHFSNSTHTNIHGRPSHGRPRKFDIRYSAVFVNEKVVLLSLGQMGVGGVLAVPPGDVFTQRCLGG